MRSGSLKLDKILDIPKWKNLQDALARVTGLAIITVDYKGVPITQHSSRRQFCGYMREHPDLEAFCQKCDSRGGLEAVRIGMPYTYLCHCHIVDIAIPIIVDDKYIGAIMAGQIKLSDKSEEDRLETILNSPIQKQFDSPDFRKQFDEIPSMSFDQLQRAVDMLSILSNYIVEEAMNKNLVLEMYEQVLSNERIGDISEGHQINTVENIRRNLGVAVVSAYIKTSSENKQTCANRILQPAIDHIFEHKGEMLPQKTASEMCHISPGHFSRLFMKETGEHYANFYSRQKVEWSKQLLEKTNLPITQISDELGFNEPGYFIKTFRKFEGITPAIYRKFIISQPLIN